MFHLPADPTMANKFYLATKQFEREYLYANIEKINH